MRKLNIPAKLKGVFAGAGSDGLNEESIAQAILQSTGLAENPSKVNVAYLGTATYDLPNPRKRQCGLLAAKGCNIQEVNVALPEVDVDAQSVKKTLDEAHVVIVSGGNTLFAMDRWKMFGIDAMLEAAMHRGCVLSGGSAGAICWFDAGHSDSMDSDTFMAPMLQAANGAAASGNKDESSAAPKDGEAAKQWNYIRVSCLGFLPGLVCPHHDKTQSNGVLRAVDFDGMMKRHPKELGICIDHWAALVVDGDSYSVLSVPGKPGSVGGEATFKPDQSGVPGVWVKRVVRCSSSEGSQEAEIDAKVLPSTGKLSSFLEVSEEVLLDPQEEVCRGLNPAK